jgi:hypothetical protein
MVVAHGATGIPSPAGADDIGGGGVGAAPHPHFYPASPVHAYVHASSAAIPLHAAMTSDWVNVWVHAE